MNTETIKPRRWGSRQEAMAHGKFGETYLHHLIRQKKIVSAKSGKKRIVDLNSIDEYYESLVEA